MNPHKPNPVSITSMLESFWHNRQLIFQMSKREVIGRYKGSILGFLWSFFNPLCFLYIYTFFFTVIFKARWGNELHDSKSEFAIMLFVGMIVYSLFSETLNRAPSLIVTNVSYVKKIVFPLEILPAVTIGSALFHAFVSVLVLLAAFLLINGFVQWTIIFLPVVLIPFIMLTLGCAWGVASLGVYLRDVSQPIGMIMTVFLFASPVFYSISTLPESIRPWIMLNPLTFIIEQARAVMILGQIPYFKGLLIYSFISVGIGWAGYAWFQKTRKGFANVL